jgi:peptidoglycan/xylan/chitin deacetylase (PgdA/CDA1 family)
MKPPPAHRPFFSLPRWHYGWLRLQRWVKQTLWWLLGLLFCGLIILGWHGPESASSQPKPAAPSVVSPTQSPTQPQTTKPAFTPPPIPAFTPPLGLPSQARIPNRFHSQIVRNIEVAPQNRVVALTFDDGPWQKGTPKVLEILRQQKVRATFFMIGRHIQMYPAIAQQVVAAGHGIGNHTWSHKFKPTSPEEIITEIENTTYLLKKATGLRTDLFRPPGGYLHNGLVDYANQKKYLTVMWTVDPADSKPKTTTQQILDHVLKETKPGSIILLHDGGGDRSATIKALPQIISGLRSQGFSFVSIPELLALQQPAIPVASPSTNPTATPVAKPTNPPAAKPSSRPTAAQATPKPTPSNRPVPLPNTSASSPPAHLQPYPPAEPRYNSH